MNLETNLARIAYEQTPNQLKRDPGEPGSCPRNRDALRYVGFSPNSNDCNAGLDSLFSDASIKRMSKSITHFLGKSLANGRPIVVPDKTIIGILSKMVDSYRAETGDIYAGKYNIPNNNLGMYDKVVLQTITLIVDNVRNTLEMENINGKLSIWTTVLGDFNDHGLRSHAPLGGEIDSTRNLFQFHMNY
jgi:hypothetical protein